MSGTWPIRLARGPVAYTGDGYRPEEHAQISAVAGLHWLQGNARPHWSVTGTITSTASRRARDCDACGCLHAEVIATWPDLAPVVALHLSDDTGSPMHAEANALYHAGVGQYSREHIGHLAAHLRVSEAYAATLIALPLPARGDHIRVIVAHARERWQAEHDAAIAWLRSVGAIETVHDGEREREI